MLLWLLWHLGKLTFYADLVHARLMIECFGGAFVVGFPGTAGTGMVSAPKLQVGEFLAMAGAFPAWRIGLSHLLCIGGFGLRMLKIASGVLCGHSGQLSHRSRLPEVLVFASLLAAATRASADIWPKLAGFHHIYAAILWTLVAILWLSWHRQQFLQQDPA